MKSILRTRIANRILLALPILICPLAWTPLFGDSTVLYDALNNNTAGADYIFGDGPLYASFSTGSSPVALSDVMAKLTAGQGAPGGSITVGLYSDAGLRPGSLLVQIAALTDSSISPAGYTNFDFPVSPAFQLKAKTRYWIGFLSVNQTVAHLAWSDDNSGPGVSTEYNIFKGALYPNSQGPYQLRITGTTVTVGAPTSLLVVSGDNQTGVAGAALTAPLVLAVMDANKNPVPGVSVTFTAANASVNPGSAQTDSNGHAATQVTLGNTPGPASVTAGVAGLPSVTFHATVNPGTLPTITSVENAASNNAPGLPNAAIAQGSIFTIFGFNLGPSTLVVASSAFQSTTLSGTSASVTVNGQTIPVLLYYTSAKQVSCLLPSNTPVGAGTITVTYNGNAGMPAPITVVQSNLGIFTVTQDGAGVGIVTYPDYSLVSDLPAANCGGPNTTCGAANPNDVLILWATGLGPVSAPDSSGPQSGNMPNIPLTLWLGGVQATVTYQGRSGCCIGEDEIVFTVPANTPTGCAVPLLVQIGGQISNNVVLPVANGSRTCSPTQTTLAGNVFQQLTTSTSAVAIGSLTLQRVPASCGTPPCQPPSVDKAKGTFVSVTVPAAYQPFIISYLDIEPIGTCLVSNKANPASPFNITNGLDAGAITVTGPNGSKALTQTPGASPPQYFANLGPGNYLAPGSYTLSATGGKDVGAFSAPLAIPAMPNWTNQSSAAIDRASQLAITWTAGGQNTYVQIEGTSYTDNTGTIGAQFSCLADPAALSFNVPPNILQQLPAGDFGNLIFAPGTLPSTYSASGLVYGVLQNNYQTAAFLNYK